MFRLALLLSFGAALSQAFAFVPASRSSTTKLYDVKNNSYLNDLSQQNPEMGAEPKVNPARPELPEIPGDYNWDEKFSGDDDWIADPTLVPGKQVVDPAQLQTQASALDALETKWRKQRDMEIEEDIQNVGWVPRAEIINGRTAMFFLVTGLLTEYWTGVSLPGQVEEMLRIGGFIGFD